MRGCLQVVTINKLVIIHTMRTLSIILLFSLLSYNNLALSQESLMYGEVRLDEVQTQKGAENVEEVQIFGMKYKKNGFYRDSTLKGSIYYSSKGEEIERTIYFGKKNNLMHRKKYDYDLAGNVLSFDEYRSQKGGGVLGKSVDYFYDDQNRLIKQVISLATITYEYYPDGRLLSKSYTYNNGGTENGEPWVMLFEYDERGNLIHADQDTTGSLQTSFYNEKNQLIRHDYYPGYAYSTYEYDSLGNCSKQVDYTLGKKGWEEQTFVFKYDSEGRITHSYSSGKKGRLYLDQEWVYFKDGRLKAEYFYVKNKRKWVNRYYYQYYPFKD